MLNRARRWLRDLIGTAGIASDTATTMRALRVVDRRLEYVERVLRATIEGNARIMTAIEDLQAVDTELATVVTDLSGAVDRIAADFDALEQAVAAGDGAAIEAEVARLRATVDMAMSAKTKIDTADVPPPPA